MNFKLGLFIAVLIAALVGGNIHFLKENGKLEERITELDGKIKTQAKTIDDQKADLEIRQKVNSELTEEKIGLLQDKTELLAENAQIKSQGPKIIETVKVVENVRYVNLGLVETKMNSYYRNLYNRTEVKQ